MFYLTLTYNFTVRRAKFEREVELKLWTINGDDIRMSKARITNSISQVNYRYHKGAGDIFEPSPRSNLLITHKTWCFEGTENFPSL
jgi:hypothetical protein